MEGGGGRELGRKTAKNLKKKRKEKKHSKFKKKKKKEKPGSICCLREQL